MNILEYKIILKDFIRRGFCEGNIDKHPDTCEKFMGITDYDELILHNNNIIDSLEDPKIEQLVGLMNMIKGDFKVCNMDFESMVPFDTEGFIFDMNNNLIIFNYP